MTLAEGKLEYEEHTRPARRGAVKGVGGGKGEAAKIAGDVSPVIWTTTPWTIPHNRGLAFHPDYEYVVIATEKGKLLLAADRVAGFQADCDIKQAEGLARFKG